MDLVSESELHLVLVVLVVLQALDVQAAHLQVAVSGDDDESERRRCRDTSGNQLIKSCRVPVLVLVLV